MSNIIAKPSEVEIASTEQIKRLCSYITDDRYIAAYLGEPVERIRRVRAETRPKKEGYRSAYFNPSGQVGIDAQHQADKATEIASAALHSRMMRLYEITAEKRGLPSIAQAAVILGMAA